MKKAFIITGLCTAVLFILLFAQTGLSKSNPKKYDMSSLISLYDSVPTSVLNLTQFMSLEASGALILDTRSINDFVTGHIPKSIYVGWNGPFKVWVAKILMDKDRPIILIADEASIIPVTLALREVGYTHVLGYLDGGIDNYKKQYILDSIPEINATSFLHLSKEGQIIDVRSVKEFTAGHIDNAVNFPLKDLSNFNIDLPKGKNFYVQCLSGYRSMIAMSILKAKGVENVINIQGGYQALKKIKEEK